MTLALAIPALNDHATLARLLREARELGCFDQYVICDDGSDPPFSAMALTRETGLSADEIRILRHETPQGPGVARNRAFSKVTCSHVLFFDADDTLTPEIARLWADLAGRRFDFCLFKHADSRVSARGRSGQMPHDEQRWRQAGLAVGTLRPVPPQSRGWLAETANYPWNKIYDTDFLRRNAIGCDTLRLHEDIRLHWLSFLYADIILSSDRLCALHHVSPEGDRLTNDRSAARLAVFASLTDLAEQLKQDADPLLQDAFLRFANGFFGWLRSNMRSDLHDRLDQAIAAFFGTSLPRDNFARITRTDPVLALRLLAQWQGAAG